MKIFRTASETSALRNQQRGSATLVLLVLMMIMLAMVAANTQSVLQLQKGVKLIERRQIERWNSFQTNATVIAKPPSAASSESQ